MSVGEFMSRLATFEEGESIPVPAALNPSVQEGPSMPVNPSPVPEPEPDEEKSEEAGEEQPAEE